MDNNAGFSSYMTQPGFTGFRIAKNIRVLSGVFGGARRTRFSGISGFREKANRKLRQSGIFLADTGV
jgi:hypothetical protein